MAFQGFMRASSMFRHRILPSSKINLTAAPMTIRRTNFSSHKILPLANRNLLAAPLAVRNQSSDENQAMHCSHPKHKKIKELQTKFQADCDAPIFLRGGAMDRLLFTTTILLSIFGLFYSLFSIVLLMK